jgi:hypothetical protein
MLVFSLNRTGPISQRLLQLCHLAIQAVVAHVLNHRLGLGQALSRFFLLTTGQVQLGVLQVSPPQDH